ncbi:MAG: HipA domain-containing protein [Eggerthellaceae bacterium]|nr:HipA domain-containing protein [Eggerthellaceae bacterium]
MALEVLREYAGQFQQVGTFDGDSAADNSTWTFQYSPSYLESANAQAISHSLPLREEPFTRFEYQGFFEGMAPEGRTRTELARRFHVSPSDFLGLLSHLGSECIGAIRFRATSDDIEEPHFTPITKDHLADLCHAPVEAVVNDLSSTRLSLAGAQSKIGVYIDPLHIDAEKHPDPEHWYEPRGTAPSTHILKIASSGSQLAGNELACMELAKACGLEIAASSTIPEFEQLFVSQRFDRWFPEEEPSNHLDGHIVPLRLHQEDFCQALGWPSYAKYEIEDTVCYAQVIGNLIAKTSADSIADKRKFARMTLFNYFIGNCDNHLKNHSFLYSPSWDAAKLAPMYDAVCTTVLGYDRKLGFCIGDHQIIDDITFDDWRLFGEDLRLGKNVISRLYQDMRDSIMEGVEERRTILPDAASDQLERITQDMKPRLRPWN